MIRGTSVEEHAEVTYFGEIFSAEILEDFAGTESKTQLKYSAMTLSFQSVKTGVEFTAVFIYRLCISWNALWKEVSSTPTPFSVVLVGIGQYAK